MKTALHYIFIIVSILILANIFTIIAAVWNVNILSNGNI
jgi:hypothetical protein